MGVDGSGRLAEKVSNRPLELHWRVSDLLENQPPCVSDLQDAGVGGAPLTAQLWFVGSHQNHA